jgi:tRNA(fMet)-specific endonuclease VapC
MPVPLAHRGALTIAAHARSRGLVLVTGDLAAFGRVAGLRCKDWPDG